MLRRAKFTSGRSHISVVKNLNPGVYVYKLNSILHGSVSVETLWIRLQSSASHWIIDLSLNITWAVNLTRDFNKTQIRKLDSKWILIYKSIEHDKQCSIFAQQLLLDKSAMLVEAFYTHKQPLSNHWKGWIFKDTV